MRTLPNICILMCSFALHAGEPGSQIDSLTKEVLPKVIQWRRHIHQYPELSNREFNTAKYVAEHLRSLGLEVRTGVAKTGVVGILKGRQPGPVIGLRADMDALPVTERLKIHFASKETAEYDGQKVGVMHACGHDAHVAMLMGAANVLSGMRDKIRGTVVFIFQPAEEGAPANEEGGAELMLKEGVLKNPKIEAIFGAHIWAALEAGRIQYKSGAAFASSNRFRIEVTGKQTHGASPWQGVDPIVTGAQIINALQTIVSRQSQLTKSPVVVTVGRIQGGIRDNIIPEKLTMSGTIRVLDTEIQKEVFAKVKHISQKVAESMGAKAEVTIDQGNPIVFNDPGLVLKMVPSLKKAVGEKNVSKTDWVTGAEDFAFFAEQIPGFYFFVGGMPPGKDSEKVAPHHTPDFFIDDSRLDVGVKAFANIVLDYPGA